MLFKSNGKVLLSSEYLVMDGAKSIALPAKLTQDLSVSECDKNTIEWQSFDKHDNLWYEDKFIVDNNELVNLGKENIISEKNISLLNHIILSLIHISRCRRIERCRNRWTPNH